MGKVVGGGSRVGSESDLEYWSTGVLECWGDGLIYLFHLLYQGVRKNVKS
jgi:hypothetical protein